jgi:tetratricopeptide (TPR) repeat protein
MFENYLIGNNTGNEDLQALSSSGVRKIMGNYSENYLELSLDYGNCGLWEEAIEVLKLIESNEDISGSRNPMIYSYLAWYYYNMNNPEKIEHYLNVAGNMPTDYCFPFRIESIEVLDFAIKNNPNDGNAYYYLGNLLFEWQPEKAKKAWQKATQISASNPIAFRNLGMAYHKEGNQAEEALSAYAKAVELNGSDQRLLYEQDLIMAASRIEPIKRLKVLQDHHESIAGNNVSDALSREVLLLVQLGNYDKALKILDENYFRQWEGVSKAYGSYVDAHLLKGLDLLGKKNYKSAMVHFNKALEYPDNMMVAQPYRGGRESEIYYYIGMTYQLMKKNRKAENTFRISAEKRLNDGLSDIHFFRAMSLKHLGDLKTSDEIFNGLVALGKDRLETSEIDFFAKFGERETADDKSANAWYLIGLGYLGLGDHEKSREAFQKAVELNINHLWAKVHLTGTNAF